MAVVVVPVRAPVRCRLRTCQVTGNLPTTCQQLQQTLQHTRGVSGHEEIILVSDDCVLMLRRRYRANESAWRAIVLPLFP